MDGYLTLVGLSFFNENVGEGILWITRDKVTFGRIQNKVLYREGIVSDTFFKKHFLVLSKLFFGPCVIEKEKLVWAWGVLQFNLDRSAAIVVGFTIDLDEDVPLFVISIINNGNFILWLVFIKVDLDRGDLCECRGGGKATGYDGK